MPLVSRTNDGRAGEHVGDAAGSVYCSGAHVDVWSNALGDAGASVWDERAHAAHNGDVSPADENGGVVSSRPESLAHRQWF